jgi:hypothetical protein
MGRATAKKRVLAAAAAGVLFLAVPAVGVASQGRVHRLCSVYRCRMLSQSATVRVFRATERDPAAGEFESTFAVWLGSGRVSALGDEHPGPDVSIGLHSVDIAGPYVVYSLSFAASMGVDEWVVGRLNARTGRRERFVVASASGFGPGGGVFEVAVTPAGTVAWIDGGGIGAPEIKDVVVIPAGSRSATRLARGSAIERRSLAVVSGHVYWSEGGIARETPAR